MKNYKGKFDLDMDLGVLRERNRSHSKFD
jgi:hypothetical protein